MSKKINDTDYLYVSAFIWGNESKLLSQERIDRMLEAKTYDDAVKVLEECDYGDLSEFVPAELEDKLADRRARMMRDLFSIAPDTDIVNVFRVKYDYHNVKVLIKSEAMNVDGARLMSDAGRITPKVLSEAYRQGIYTSLPKALSDAMQEAKDVLARTGDPQLSDFILDKAYYNEFLELATSSGSEYLIGYGKLSIDTANLRAAVRAARMDKDSVFLQQVLAEGGDVGTERIITTIMSKAPLSSLYNGSPLYKASVAATTAVQGGRLTEFEKLCDDALFSYIAPTKMSRFSEKVLVGYICAVENEISAVRIIMTGRLAGLSADVIRERLRESYV